MQRKLSGSCRLRAAPSVRAVLAAFPQMLSAGNLGALGDIEDRMEVGVVVGQFNDVAIWKSVTDALDEFSPFGIAVQVVGHEEAAALDVVAKFSAFLFGQAPFAHLDGIDPREIESVVIVVESHYLFDRTDIDTRQAAHGPRQMAVGARVVLGPEGTAVAVIALKSRKVTVDARAASGKH